MADIYKNRRTALILIVTGLLFFVLLLLRNQDSAPKQNTPKTTEIVGLNAIESLDKLDIREKTRHQDYKREYFGDGWGEINGCDTRNVILFRDLKNIETDGRCTVLTGELFDPYTSTKIRFKRGKDSSKEVQIDHVVALSDAWLKGADNLSKELRVKFANDPLELLAVSGSSNQKKSGSDASEWLPENVHFRCEYIARQIAIKIKYNLFVSSKEKYTMSSVLNNCKEQKLPAI